MHRHLEREAGTGRECHYPDTGPTPLHPQRRKVNPSNMFSAPPRAQAIGGTHEVVRSDFFSADTFDLVEKIGHTPIHAHTHEHDVVACSK